MSKQHRAIKYRIYPTAEQANLFVRTFGCCRFVYNQMLDVQNSRYKNGESHLSKYEANNYCRQNLKSKYDYLNEVDSFAIINASFALSDAFARFFKLLGRYPKYKSKHKSKKSYTTDCTNNNIRILDNAIKLPKVGVVKAKLHRLPKDDWKLKSATVSLSGCGKFYVSVLFEYEQDITPIKVNEDNVIGFDYSTPHLYVDNNGHTPEAMLKFYKLSANKLAKEQRKLCRKVEGSANWKKQIRKINKIHSKVANQRNDALHKLSTAIAKQYDAVAIETIFIREQLQSMPYKHYRRSAMDNGWYNFTVMLDYKLKERGKQLIKVDEQYLSSQICNHCGEVNPKVKDLKIRKWECPNCGTHHDRDINAAINIRKEGLKMLRTA